MISKILVIRNGAIGDTINLLPVIATLRLNYPQSYIELSGYSERLELAVHPRYADRASSFAFSGLSLLSFEGDVLPEKVIKYITQFSLVIAFIGDKENIFAQNLNKLKIQKYLVFSPLPESSSKIHITNYLLSALGPLNLNNISNTAEIFVSQNNSEFANDYWCRNKLEGKPVIAIHLGSGSIKKCWAKENYLQLTNILINLGYKIIMISGPADEDIINFMRHSMQNNENIIFAENIPLLQLAAIIRKCNAFAGNDSGITHLSAAVGTPTVALYGPTDPGIWAPRGKNIKALFNPELNKITVKEVCSTLDEIVP